jgi:hypothetical protein
VWLVRELDSRCHARSYSFLLSRIILASPFEIDTCKWLSFSLAMACYLGSQCEIMVSRKVVHLRSG